MQEKDEHYIQSKWVDCKSAIPIAEMKSMEDQDSYGELSPRKEVFTNGDETRIHEKKIRDLYYQKKEIESLLKEQI